MATRELHSRIYKREYASGSVRLWADFRDFADVGGGQEAVKPGDVGQALQWEGDAERREKLTRRANKFVRDRLEELEDARDRRIQTGVRKQYGLREFGSFHLRQKAKAGNVTDEWISQMERHYRSAVAFFGKDRELASIRPPHVRQWIDHLRETSNGRGDTLSEKTIRDYINSLSNLYRRAQSEEVVPSGYNPVGDLVDKPTPERNREAGWFEPHDAALILEAARVFDPDPDARAYPHIHELVATALLTGGRKSEILGLEVDDVSFDRDVIRFRPNEHRRLKTNTSTRTVPIWPQLREILLGYLNGEKAPESGLLFPSARTGKMLTNVRNSLDEIGKLAGFAEKEVRMHRFRHTYTAARIQTVEHGAPVALFTVARELGHSSTRLIEQRYGHLLTNRRAREEVVEFRAEVYQEEIGEQVREMLQVVA